MRPLRVYVAGAFIERHERAAVWIARLREAGIEITHDWTVSENTTSNAEHSDSLIPTGERMRLAALDLDGVRRADLVWLCAAKDRGASGSWVELGAALALEKNVIVSGANCRRTIFTELADRLFESDEEAFEHVVMESFAWRSLTRLPGASQ